MGGHANREPAARRVIPRAARPPDPRDRHGVCNVFFSSRPGWEINVQPTTREPRAARFVKPGRLRVASADRTRDA